MPTFTTICHLLTLTLLLVSIKGAVTIAGAIELLPAGPVEYRNVRSMISREPPFQVCGKCQCCEPDGRTNCYQMSCCMEIMCNLPNKPFGVCAFLPKTCTCNACS